MNGVINLLKLPGMTSQQAVSRVRQILGVKKAGHAGTLDPGACGVLPVCVGRATKLARFLTDGKKQYVAELTLGVKTDTLDSYGTVVERQRPKPVSEHEVLEVLREMTGRMSQKPPAYSAVKVRGRPLYSYARNGQSMEAAARPVAIYRLHLLKGCCEGPFLLQIDCSKGTYVRVLLSEIAERLGQIGYTSLLIRTRVGAFGIEGSCTLGELKDQAEKGELSSLLPPEEVAPGEQLILPAYLYDILDSGAKIIANKVRGLEVEQGKLYSVYCQNVFFGVGEFDGSRLALSARVKL